MLLSSCKQESYIPVLLPDVVYQDIGVKINAGSPPLEIDVDDDDNPEYTFLVSSQETNGRTRQLFRLQGSIQGILTSVVHSRARLYDEVEGCNTADPYALEAMVFRSGDTVDEELDNWRMVGDFHLYDNCFGPECACTDASSVLDYRPLERGEIGYLILRFIRLERKHFAWIEIERLDQEEVAFLVKRVAWRSKAGEALGV